jgi:acetyl-CoA C-acetyltransferase
MGLTAEGCGAVAALEGWTQIDGRLPVNPSGGLKAKGHPSGVFNMGGAAVANYVSVLERLR